MTLFLFAALAVTSVDAAWYQKTDGTIVDPIQFWYGGNYSYSGNNLEPHANLTGANLTLAKLYEANLTSANLTGASLDGVDLDGANLTGANLSSANMSSAVLWEADLSSANLTSASLDGASLTGSNITESQFLSAASVTGVNLTGHTMSGWDLTGVDLSDAELENANLTGASLDGASLTGSNITESQFLSAASVTGVNLTGHTMSGWDLTGVDLSDAELENANLTGASLDGASLTGSNITESQFLSAASVTGVNLTGHTMSGWDLTGVDLSDAELDGVNLHLATLPSAMPSLPVINNALVSVTSALDVDGSVQVDTGGNLSVMSASFTAADINMQGGALHGSLFGINLDEIGDVSGYGRLFGDVDLGASGAIAGSGAGLELFGHVSGSGTISGTTLFGNLDIGSSPGAITLEDVTLSAAGTTTFEVGGTTLADYDRILLAGGVMLDGVMNVSFMDGFMPAESDTFQLIDLGTATVTGWFSSVNTPAGWSLSASGSLYNNSTAVPEPAAILLALFGLALLPRRRRR